VSLREKAVKQFYIGVVFAMLFQRSQHVERGLVYLRLMFVILLVKEVNRRLVQWLLRFSTSLLQKAETVKVFDKADYLGQVHALGPNSLGVTRLQELCEVRILLLKVHL
jgi:hypothetical protein